MDDCDVTNINTPVVLTVVANDSDPDGDRLSVASFRQPSSGVVSLNADDTHTYTPDTGYAGIDTFTYTITDGHGGTATAAVTIRIQPGMCMCGSSLCVWLCYVFLVILVWDGNHRPRMCVAFPEQCPTQWSSGGFRAGTGFAWYRANPNYLRK